MLLELYIKNIAIVDELRVRFDPGFSVLTGETGAGKSVILGALSLVLGERIKGELLPDGIDRGMVEALFEIPKAHPVVSYVAAQNLTFSEGEPLVLRREIVRTGNHRNYVNGQYVSLAVLKSIGDFLIDFHGQHDHQSLLRTEQHLDLLDYYTEAISLREEVQTLFAQKQKLVAEAEELSRLEKEREENLEFLQFQLSEIAQAKLKEEEEDQLQIERNRLAHSEKLCLLLQEALSVLSEEERAALELAGVAYRSVQEAAKLDPTLEEESERLKSLQIELREAVSSLQNRLEKIQADPTRLEEIEQRLSLIWKLKKKYGGSLAEVLRFLSEQQEKLKLLESAGERLAQLQEKIKTSETSLQKKAAALSALRKKAAPSLAKKIEKELRDLGMERCRFEVGFVSQPVGPRGGEEAEFLIAPNVGESPKPLRAIASGGEISRVMLALKAIFAAGSPVPTLIFDEIDVNLGAAVAQQVGKKMASLSKSKQIVCITHLPQVASLAEHHYRVHKQVVRGRTQTSITLLKPSEKTEEVARMLSGEQITSLALQHAQELIQGKRK